MIGAAVATGLVLRLALSAAIEVLARRRGTPCLFPDADIYWQLAGSILQGGPYRVMQWGIPHDALRTPGFPLFLAACRAIFGDSTLAPRLVQSALGALSIVMAARLTRLVRPLPTAAALAAWIVACDPFVVGFTGLLLSEAAFLPLMLGLLIGLARIWMGQSRRGGLWALLSGLSAGLAVLVKPSFALFLPIALGAWLLSVRRRSSIRLASLVVLGFLIAMAPWWARNARVLHRFVPTAIWGGASLYDGLNPHATGASDMSFLEEPDLVGLDEVAQDRELKARAWRFARENPGRSLELAAIKAARFWSPRINAEGYRSPALGVATSVWTWPLYGLMAAGLFQHRRDPRAWVLLAGPLLYFAAIHLLFVGSVRYRVPAMVPAIGLAALAAGPWTCKMAPPEPEAIVPGE
ncbi:MAG: glycosyltransferase family 39 protein [Isosphaeraceae bacterium]